MTAGVVPATRAGLRQAWPVLVLALAIAVVGQLIGQLSIRVGVASIVVFPMVWALLLGTVVSVQRVRPMGLVLQKIASAVVGAAVAVLVARLAFSIGPNLSLLVRIGPALLLQEIGHVLGTLGLALPLAVLLRMGRSTVGATFSLDREPSFAIVSERYGADSDEYRGVLAMYVFGTLFGAVYISLLASVVTSTGVFDPLALAMGAGVGSGSMLAAATASIAAVHPDAKDAITATAAVSNLLTTVLGVYVGIYLALPLAHRLYRALTRRRVEAPSPAATEEDNRVLREEVAAASSPVTLPIAVPLPAIVVIGIATAALAAHGMSWAIVGGYAVLAALVLVSAGLGRLTRLSPILWITTLGVAASSPWSPAGQELTTVVNSVDLLSVATVMLTCAGLSLGKDIPLLRRIGWRIVPVGLVAISASFLLSTVIAEFVLGFWS